MKPIEQLLKQIQELEVSANMNLENAPTRTLAGLSIRKRESQDQLVVLGGKYEEYVRQNAVPIVLRGDQESVSAFAALARGADVPVVDADALYRRLAVSIWPSVGGNGEFGSTQLVFLTNALHEVAEELKIRNEANPRLLEMMPAKSEEQLVDSVRQIVRDTVGDSLNIKYLETVAIKNALKIRYNQVIVPVVVAGAKADEFKAFTALFQKTGQVISVTKESLTEEKVLEILSSSLKQKSTKTKTPQPITSPSTPSSSIPLEQ